MSTIDPLSPSHAASAARELAASTTGSGGGWSLPDERMLTRLANAFYAALPGAPEDLTVATPSSAAQGITKSLHTSLPGAPPNLPGATPSSAAQGITKSLPTSVPGAPQSLTSATPSSAAQAVAKSLPTSVPATLDEADLGALLAGLASRPGAVSPASRSAPLPGPTSALATVKSPQSALYFLNNIRSAPPWRTTLPGEELANFATYPGRSPAAFDAQAIRRDFPALHQLVNGRPLVWLDNAATTQKPQSVIDATSVFYSRDNSNIHRGAHTLAARATDAFEGARDKVRAFIGANDVNEIVFVRGTTEAINLVAQSYGRNNIGRGDEILITAIEHHANIVPWQLLIEQTGATLRVAPVNDSGELLLEQFAGLLGPRTKLVSVTHVANALGTVIPIDQVIALSHAAGAPVLVDAAQSAPHMPLNVVASGADFLVLSGHKIFGPTGIGVLYGKYPLLEAMPPWQGGGGIIEDVTFAKSRFQHAPAKFEAGTPDIAGAVGLGAAIDYLTAIGMEAIRAYEHELLAYATAGLQSVRGLRLIGTAPVKASVLSFVIDDISVEAIAEHLDKNGIAARAGHHCAIPALRRFGVDRSVRASLALYNTREDVDALVSALHRLAGYS